MFDEFISYMKDECGNFKRLDDVATEFKKDNPLAEWAEKNPYLTGAKARPKNSL